MFTYNACLFLLSTENGSGGLAGMKGWKGPGIKNGTLSIKAGFLPSLCVITCTRQLCAWAYLVYTACLPAWLSPCKASLDRLLRCFCLSWHPSLVCRGCRGQPWKRRRAKGNTPRKEQCQWRRNLSEPCIFFSSPFSIYSCRCCLHLFTIYDLALILLQPINVLCNVNQMLMQLHIPLY